MKLDLKNARKLLILGGTRGIGLAFVEHISAHYPNIEIYAVHRKESDIKKLSLQKRTTLFEMDLFDSEDIEKVIKQVGEVDIFINTIGILHSEQISPEKSLKDFEIQKSLEQFKINTLLTPLWAKYLKSFLSKNDPSLFLCLSAKVGSIDDNHIGGWHTYRASKSALNMMLKNIAIEFKRSRLQTQVVAVHPGTTITDLSKPFIENTPYQLWQPAQTVEHILEALDGIGDDSGVFLDWKGGYLPW